jgi:hypothetical protein
MRGSGFRSRYRTFSRIRFWFFIEKIITFAAFFNRPLWQILNVSGFSLPEAMLRV